MIRYHLLMACSRALCFLPLLTESHSPVMLWMFNTSGRLELLADEIAYRSRSA
jgi:hypothetical protein